MAPPKAEVNPFLLPGWESSPLRPLCPWERPEDEGYYVPINHTAEAYEEFTAQMGALRWLDSGGRLTLVTGDSGCGKTSLVNRCVGWLLRALQERYQRGVVVDLSLGPKTRQSVDERMAGVCALLFDRLLQEKVLDGERAAALRERLAQPERFYRYLAGELPDEVVLVVLLPATDLVDEVVSYAHLAGRKTLFFTESSYLDERHAHLVRQGTAKVPIPPVALRVGSLRTGDVARFAADRLGRHDRGHFPTMSATTVRSMAGPLRSIAMLQRVLSGVYEDRKNRGDRYSDTDEITFADITEYFYDRFLRDPGTAP
ncbi:hypothetical protein V5P93_005358 [Actinokineospora auranticolor]|uniref:AAA+ ATPase domain-containing protein n=1 Tax=Actinokineospora auranticolor TaxID=155976 RepID=A0A2S6GQT4_9PSEU|nr:ATP-binding protein [Actinokineospora auranticolor]PPK67615.1 hypothetical protein CLV40_107281 [Actinokineospora auranticolor]